MFIPKCFPTKILSIIIGLMFFTSCSNQPPANSGNSAQNSNSANENTTASKDDTAELNSMVLLPFVPVETVFREENDKNKLDQKKLVAVLKFTPEDANNLIAQAEKHRPAEAVQVGTEDWFPAELVAQTQLSGDEMLKGKAYGANDFLQMPYKTGKLIKVDNSDFFILEVSTN